MSYGILTDNRTRYNKGVALYHETLKDYLKWGKGANAEGGRMIGECSETLRDIYHSQFGIGECCRVTFEQLDNFTEYCGLCCSLRVSISLQETQGSALRAVYNVGLLGHRMLPAELTERYIAACLSTCIPAMPMSVARCCCFLAQVV
jgi:hypothetical protein